MNEKQEKALMELVTALADRDEQDYKARGYIHMTSPAQDRVVAARRAYLAALSEPEPKRDIAAVIEEKPDMPVKVICGDTIWQGRIPRTVHKGRTEPEDLADVEPIGMPEPKRDAVEILEGMIKRMQVPCLTEQEAREVIALIRDREEKVEKAARGVREEAEWLSVWGAKTGAMSACVGRLRALAADLAPQE